MWTCESIRARSLCRVQSVPKRNRLLINKEFIKLERIRNLGINWCLIKLESHNKTKYFKSTGSKSDKPNEN